MAESVHAALKPVLESGQLAGSRKVAEFESRLAAWLGVPEVVVLSDASGALALALQMAGVAPGDEVITSPLACSATLMPIANLSAHPVWCDIDPLTGMPSAEHVAGLISEKTRAILLYHWSGDVGDVEDLLALTRRHNIKLVEDASEAFGAESRRRRLGGEADFTVYSFYATKHVTTGEGAALISPSGQAATSARHLRRFGLDPAKFRLPNGDLNPDFDIPLAGFNLAMNELGATLGIEHLNHADWIVARHYSNGAFYDRALAGIPGLHLLNRRSDCNSAYWTYALRVERRDALIRKLHSSGIGAQRLHMRNDAYTCFGSVLRDLPGVATFDAENLSIPCGWWVGEEERQYVVNCIREGW